MLKRPIALLVSLCFAFTNIPYIQARDLQAFELSAPGSMIHLSVPLNPPVLQGIKVHSENPFLFDFIMDNGSGRLQQDQLKDESARLIKYFLAGMTVPENDLWVNLSPYEKARIIPKSFGLTQMGRDLLAEDYLLKQLTSSLIYPEDATGKAFWKRVYEEAAKKFGTTDIPVNTFNKVWIVPQKAMVYENVDEGTAYVVESKLKVMLEQDYLSLAKHNAITGPAAQKAIGAKDTSALGSQIIREIVIPQLTKEVNEGRNFARLRQVYSSLILATWYKRKIKDSILNDVYSNQNKVAGVNIKDPREKERIYQLYLQAFRKGVYNYIKEEQDPVSRQMVPRHYFSGGFQMDMSMLTTTTNPSAVRALPVADHSMVRVGIKPPGTEFAAFMKKAVLTMVAGAWLCTAAGCGGGSQNNNGGGGGGGVLQPPTQPTITNVVINNNDTSGTVAPYLQSPEMNPLTGLSQNNLITSTELGQLTAQGINVDNEIDGTNTEAQAMLLIALRQTGTGANMMDNSYVLDQNDDGNPNTPTYPWTINVKNYSPTNGVYRNVRDTNFSEPNWEANWDFGVDVRENAWIGLAALHNLVGTGDQKLLKFALERASFLGTMMPQSGGIAFGPKGQFSPNGDTNFFFDLKDTPSNGVALQFFDALGRATKDPQWTAAADAIFGWYLATYSPVNGVFLNTATSTDGITFKLGDIGTFTPESTAFMPVDRIIADQAHANIYGGNNTVADRMTFMDQVIKNTENLTAIKDNLGNVLGFNYGIDATMKDVLSIQYSLEMAVLYYQMSEAYQTQGNNTMAAFYKAKFDFLMTSLKKYEVNVNGATALPAAVYFSTGLPAEGVVLKSLGLTTAFGFGDKKASMWYKFASEIAVGDFNPLHVDNAMVAKIAAAYRILQAERASHPAVIPAEVTAAKERAIARETDKAMFTKGGIDLNPDQMGLVIKTFTGTLGKQTSMKFKLDPAMRGELLKSAGFEPVIISVQPLKNLPAFLGFNQAAAKA
jgi:hypothetical protein